MRCGRGHEHGTVAEVRDCYGVAAKLDAPMTTVHDGKDGQYELIQRLLSERNMTPLPPYEEASKVMTKRDASSYIGHLINDIPKPVAANKVAKRGAPKKARGKR